MTRTVNPDIQQWNEKYKGQNRGGSLVVNPVGEPELVDCLPLLQGTGLAMEIACGKGENALYLASLGYQVVACDGAQSGLTICQRSASRLDLPVYPLQCDLETIVLPESRFSLISVVRYLQKSLFGRIISALKPGGLVFYKTFNINLLANKPGFNPDYLVQIGELNEIFSSFEILASDFNAKGVATAEAKTTSFILARKALG